jgi:hypothetical protein
MGNSQSHINQWKHNRKLLTQIPPEFPDWQVTVAFYVALQAVDALLAFDKLTRVNSHEARNEVLLKTKRYQKINEKFFPLYDLSRTVRYLADPARWVPADRVQKDVIYRYLRPIETSVQSLMGTDLNLPDLVLATAPLPPPTA